MESSLRAYPCLVHWIHFDGDLLVVSPLNRRSVATAATSKVGRNGTAAACTTSTPSSGQKAIERQQVAPVIVPPPRLTRPRPTTCCRRGFGPAVLFDPAPPGWRRSPRAGG